jgi:hypothetical protein
MEENNTNEQHENIEDDNQKQKSEKQIEEWLIKIR